MKKLDNPASLADAILEAARHVEEMGCTCLDRSDGHQADCVGWDRAEQVRAALPRAEALEALVEAYGQAANLAHRVATMRSLSSDLRGNARDVSAALTAALLGVRKTNHA